MPPFKRVVPVNMHVLQHVSVWLDDLPSGQTSFRQAVDFANRLSLRVQVIASCHPADQSAGRHDAMEVSRTEAPHAAKLKAWGEACGQHGIVMDTLFFPRGTEAGMQQFLRPMGIMAVEHSAASRFRQELLDRSLYNPDVMLLLCAPQGALASRMLIVHQQTHASVGYLEAAARFCQGLATPPVVLIVATTEYAAERQQSHVQGVCASLGLQAEFDIVIGCTLREAVARAASWRRCSHVILERSQPASWWERLRGDEVLGQILSLSGSLNILALPEGAAFEVPQRVEAESAHFSRNRTSDECRLEVHGEPV